jgi:hypothetical protein
MRRSRSMNDMELPMNDMALLWELAQDTPLAAPAELGAARGRLVAAIAAYPAAGRSATASPSALPPTRRAWPRRRLVLAGAVAASMAAAAMAVLVSVSGAPVGHVTPSVDPGAAQILRLAALAALKLPDGAPRSDQFVYTKIGNGDGGSYQSWLSVDGTRTGLVRGAGGVPADVYIPGCRGGYQLPVSAPRAQGGTPGGQPCVQAPAYFPDMPASPRALLTYLEQTRRVNPALPSDLNAFGKIVHQLLSQTYLSSGQRAALYEVMAQTPGFTLVPDVVDGIGRHGEGVAWSLPNGGGKNMIIFDPNTYAELGVTTWGAKGEQSTGALLKLAIVNTAGELP